MSTNDQDTSDTNAPEPDSDGADMERNLDAEAEFKITVRKLDVAARPRGVLAE
jgi:hypothetical protein